MKCARSSLIGSVVVLGTKVCGFKSFFLGVDRSVRKDSSLGVMLNNMVIDLAVSSNLNYF